MATKNNPYVQKSIKEIFDRLKVNPDNESIFKELYEKLGVRKDTKSMVLRNLDNSFIEEILDFVKKIPAGTEDHDIRVRSLIVVLEDTYTRIRERQSFAGKYKK